MTIVLLRRLKLRSYLVFTAAYVSHTLLDYMLTESRGVALWWPFTNHRYKLQLPNPIGYTYSVDSFSQAAKDLLKISLVELLIFAPLLLAAISVRQVVIKRSRLNIEAIEDQ